MKKVDMDADNHKFCETEQDQTILLCDQSKYETKTQKELSFVVYISNWNQTDA